MSAPAVLMEMAAAGYAHRSLLKKYEKRLDREGLAALDYDDGAGGIRVGNRGSGKVLDASRAFGRNEATERATHKRAIVAEYLQRHVYADTVGDRLERRVLRLYASGASVRAIEKRTGVGRQSVQRLVTRVSMWDRAGTLGELVAACEPSTLVLVFTLLETALDEPQVVRGLLTAARTVPELRAMIQPDGVGDG